MKKTLLTLLLAGTVVTASSCSSDSGINIDKRGDNYGEDFETVSQEQSIEKTETSKGKYEFRIDGELPDIGEFSASEVKGESDAPYEFVASKKYGRIIPYIGAYKLYEEKSSDWSARVGYNSYGFVDEKGNVIMRDSFKNAYVTYNVSDDGFGYYNVSREMTPKEDAPDEYMPAETLIIPEDGSWCISITGNGSWVSGIGGGYISVIRYPEEYDGIVKTELYNYKGKLIRILEGVDSVSVGFHGLFMVGVYEDGTYNTYFENEAGERVLGPYTYAVNFNQQGVTCVKDEYGACLINTEGEILTDFYDTIYRERIGDSDEYIFTARKNDLRSSEKYLDIYSASGELMATIEGATYASFKAPDNGDYIYYFTEYDYNYEGEPIYNTERAVYRRFSDGSELVSKEFGVSPNSYACTDNCYIHLDKENGICYLFDADGETISKIDGGVSEILCVSKNGEYVVYTTGKYEYKYDETTDEDVSVDTRKTYIYNTKSEKVVKSFDCFVSAYLHYDNKRYIELMRMISGNTVYLEQSETSLFDTETGEMAVEECDAVNVYNFSDKAYIATFKDNCSVLYDEDLNVIRKSYYE